MVQCEQLEAELFVVLGRHGSQQRLREETSVLVLLEGVLLALPLEALPPVRSGAYTFIGIRLVACFTTRDKKETIITITVVI